MRALTLVALPTGAFGLRVFRRRQDRHALRRSRARREGVATTLIDALEKARRARASADRIETDASDSARDFFARRGYVAAQRNTDHARRRMARQHHDEKRWPDKVCRQKPDALMARERLSLFDTTLRDGAQTTGVDFSSTTRDRSRGCSTIWAWITSGRLSWRQSAGHRILLETGRR